MLKMGLCFDDVLLVPQYSEIESRSSLDIETELGRHLVLNVPIISSPMDTITGFTMSVAMDRCGGLGIIHRYNSVEQQSMLVWKAVEKTDARVAAAIGVSGDYLDRATAVYDAGAKVLCIDIAHGHHILMKKALYEIRQIFGNEVHIMAGNVATLSAFNDLADWGADSIRVGIGGGSICSTRIQTGHGVPTFQSILECASSDRDATLIADGGITTSGDIVKALAAGADAVMLGSLLAGTTEAPGEIFYRDGYAEKVYRGMASKDAQIEWRGHTSSIEGVSSTVPVKGPVGAVLQELETGIKSGLSYSGAKNIQELQAKAKFIRQTSSGAVESSTHIRV